MEEELNARINPDAELMSPLDMEKEVFNYTFGSGQEILELIESQDQN